MVESKPTAGGTEDPRPIPTVSAMAPLEGADEKEAYLDSVEVPFDSGETTIGHHHRPVAWSGAVRRWNGAPTQERLLAPHESASKDEVLDKLVRQVDDDDHYLVDATSVPAWGSTLYCPGDVGGAAGEGRSSSATTSGFEKPQPSMVAGSIFADVPPATYKSLPTEYPQRCFGSVIVDGVHVGNCTLVGPRHVVTAAHVVYNRAESQLRVMLAPFVIRMWDGSLITGNLSPTYNVVARYDSIHFKGPTQVGPPPLLPNDHIPHDYSVLVLDTPPQLHHISNIVNATIRPQFVARLVAWGLQHAQAIAEWDAWSNPQLDSAKGSDSFGWLGTGVYQSSFQDDGAFDYAFVHSIPNPATGLPMAGMPLLANPLQLYETSGLSILGCANWEDPGGVSLKFKGYGIPGVSGAALRRRHPTLGWDTVYAVYAATPAWSFGSGNANYLLAAGGFALLCAVWAARNRLP